jgi:hypothetical protein
MKELLYKSISGHQVWVDRESEQITVSDPSAAPIIQFDSVTGKINLFSPQDIEIRSSGKLKLRGDDGVEIDGGGDVRLVSAEETIIRGKMVRIN